MLGPLEIFVSLHPPTAGGTPRGCSSSGAFIRWSCTCPICLIVLVPVLEVMARFKRWQGHRPADGMLLGLATVTDT